MRSLSFFLMLLISMVALTSPSYLPPTVHATLLDPREIALAYGIPFPTTASTTTAPGVSSPGTASMGVSSGVVSSMTAVSPTPAVPPGNFPFGFFNFKITGILVGQTVSVEFVAPSAIPVGSVWVKIKPDGSTVNISPTHLDGNVMTFSLTDGNPNTDDDGVANGQITDPGGPGIPAAVGIPEYPLEPVPIAALVLALASFFLIRRRIR